MQSNLQSNLQRARRRSNSSSDGSTLTDCESQEFGDEIEKLVASSGCSPQNASSRQGAIVCLSSGSSGGASSEDGDSAGSGEEEKKALHHHQTTSAGVVRVASPPSPTSSAEAEAEAEAIESMAKTITTAQIHHQHHHHQQQNQQQQHQQQHHHHQSNTRTHTHTHTQTTTPSSSQGKSKTANKKKTSGIARTSTKTTTSSPKSVVLSEGDDFCIASNGKGTNSTNTSSSSSSSGDGVNCSSSCCGGGGAGGSSISSGSSNTCSWYFSMRGDEGLVFGSQEHFERMLTYCINAFDELITRSLRVQSHVKDVLVEEVTAMIRESCPAACVQVFGSCTTGLALPHSDIDLVVQLQPTAAATLIADSSSSSSSGSVPPLPCSPSSSSSNCSPPLSTSDVMRGLYALSDRMHQQSWAIAVTPISTSTVPVIKFSVQAGEFLRAAGEADRQKRQKEASSTSFSPCSSSKKEPWYFRDPFLHEADKFTIPVDITIEAGEHRGLQTCVFVRDALLRRHPCLSSVIKLVKNLMHWSNLNNAFTGGLSSYSIVLMCCAAHDNLFFVREQERSGLEKETVPEDQLAGKLFLHFLAMFSAASFDPTVFGIDVCDVANPSCLFRLSSEECSNIGTSLWIRDPFATSKNVARPSFNFKHASLCFAEVLANLTSEHVKMIEEGDVVWDKSHFRPALFRFFLW